MELDAGVATHRGQGLDGQIFADPASLPYTFYSGRTTRVRHDEFIRRGRLTRELTALGLPPVYEFPKGVLVGQPVSTQPETPSANNASRNPGNKKADRQRLEEPTGAWRRLRTRALNPAHNPVMARNIRLKAQLAAAAARGASAVKTPPSARLLRYMNALDEASRTIAKLQVASSGAEPQRMSSAPISKPYYPRRQRGGVPANEVEGGDMWPGRLARRVAEQTAEEGKEQQRATSAAAAGLRSPRAVERQRQIQELADVIVAAPNLGIHELGAYLPHELHTGASSSAAGTMDHPYDQDSHVDGKVAMPTPELAEALRQLELRAAAGRAAVTAAEDDYGSHLFGHDAVGRHRTHAAIAIPVLSPVASLYGSGGHYLYEEGMAEDSCMEGSGSDHDGSDGGSDHEEDGSTAIADSDGGAAEEPASRPRSSYPEKMTVQENADAGLVVTRYPAGSAVWRQRVRGRSDAAGVFQTNAASTQGALTLQDFDRMRLCYIQPGNEVAGGRQRQGSAAPAPALVTPGSPANTSLVGSETANQLPTPSPPVMVGESTHGAQTAAAAAAAAVVFAGATKEESFAAPIAVSTAPRDAAEAAPAVAAAAAVRTSAAMMRLPNEVSYTGRVRRLQQPEIAGKDLSGVWTQAAITAVTARPAAAGVGRNARATKSGVIAGGGSSTSYISSAGANPSAPSWRRESHAERTEVHLPTEATVAAAAPAAEAAEGQVNRSEGGEERKVGAGRLRVAVRAGTLTSAPVKVARHVAASDRFGGGGGQGVTQPITQWGGAQVGRIVAVAVPASNTAISPVSITTLPADTVAISEGTTVAALTLPDGTVEEEQIVIPAAARSADTVSSTGYRAEQVDLRASQRAAALLRQGGPVGDGSVADADAGADGPSLDRFGMLSDVESDREEELAEEVEFDCGAEAHADPAAHGPGRTDHNAAVRRGQGVSARDDPWDSSSDDENPWGVENADEMGYPVKAPVGTMVQSSTAARPASKASCVQAAPAIGQNLNNVDVGLVERKGPVDGGGSSNSSSAGSWGIRRHREGPGGAGSTAARETKREVAAKTSRATVPVAQAEAVTLGNPLGVGGDGLRNLRHMFGLTVDKGRAVNPSDIPPLPLTTPPVWLVRPYGMEHLADDAQKVRNDGSRPSAAVYAYAKGGKLPGKRQPSLGRVEAALMNAQSSVPVRVVRHDSRTFYFSEPPSYPASS